MSRRTPPEAVNGFEAVSLSRAAMQRRCNGLICYGELIIKDVGSPVPCWGHLACLTHLLEQHEGGSKTLTAKYNGSCAVCSKTIRPGREIITTSEYLGWVCPTCNVTLPSFGEFKELVSVALKKHGKAAHAWKHVKHLREMAEGSGEPKLKSELDKDEDTANSGSTSGDDLTQAMAKLSVTRLTVKHLSVKNLTIKHVHLNSKE